MREENSQKQKNLEKIHDINQKRVSNNIRKQKREREREIS